MRVRVVPEYSELPCGVLSLTIDILVMSGLQSFDMAPERQEEAAVAMSKVRDVPDFCNVIKIF